MPRARIIEGTEGSPFKPSAIASSRDADGPEARVERAFADGYEKGFAEGRAHALAEESRELENLRDALERDRHLLSEVGGQALVLLRDEIFGLVVETATKLLRERVEAGDPIVTRTLDAVLEKHQPPHGAEFICHPEDADLVRQALAPAADKRHWTVREDSALARGGLLVRAESENVDARIESLLRRCLENLHAEETLA